MTGRLGRWIHEASSRATLGALLSRLEVISDHDRIHAICSFSDPGAEECILQLDRSPLRLLSYTADGLRTAASGRTLAGPAFLRLSLSNGRTWEDASIALQFGWSEADRGFPEPACVIFPNALGAENTGRTGFAELPRVLWEGRGDSPSVFGIEAKSDCLGNGSALQLAFARRLESFRLEGLPLRFSRALLSGVPEPTVREGADLARAVFAEVASILPRAHSISFVALTGADLGRPLLGPHANLGAVMLDPPVRKSLREFHPTVLQSEWAMAFSAGWWGGACRLRGSHAREVTQGLCAATANVVLGGLNDWFDPSRMVEQFEKRSVPERLSDIRAGLVKMAKPWLSSALGAHLVASLGPATARSLLGDLAEKYWGQAVPAHQLIADLQAAGAVVPKEFGSGRR